MDVTSGGCGGRTESTDPQFSLLVPQRGQLETMSSLWAHVSFAPSDGSGTSPILTRTHVNWMLERATWTNSLRLHPTLCGPDWLLVQTDLMVTESLLTISEDDDDYVHMCNHNAHIFNFCNGSLKVKTFQQHPACSTQAWPSMDFSLTKILTKTPHWKTTASIFKGTPRVLQHKIRKRPNRTVQLLWRWTTFSSLSTEQGIQEQLWPFSDPNRTAGVASKCDTPNYQFLPQCQQANKNFIVFFFAASSSVHKQQHKS